MNKKEIGEIRRRVRRDRSNIAAIFGCYVSDDKKIISEFKSSLGLLPENEQEKYFALFKKIFSGKPGKTLQDLNFPTSSVANKEARHQQLMKLRKETLSNAADRKAFYQTIISSLDLEGKYVILLGCDLYDVPFKNKNDEMDHDAGSEVFKYILCAICPVKDTKPNLHYVHAEATFHDGGMLQSIGNPELGFMFPAFNGRAADIYSVLYFSKDTANNHPDFVDCVFGVKTPVAAALQQKQFQDALRSGLGEECSIDVLQSFQQQLQARINLHKETKVADPLVFNSAEICFMLGACGVSDKKLKSFEAVFDSAFGTGRSISAENLIDLKRCEIQTERVAIRMEPEAVGCVEMRKIGGVDYILIPATDYVEVNGVPVAQN